MNRVRIAVALLIILGILVDPSSSRAQGPAQTPRTYIPVLSRGEQQIVVRKMSGSSITGADCRSAEPLDSLVAAAAGLPLQICLGNYDGPAIMARHNNQEGWVVLLLSEETGESVYIPYFTVAAPGDVNMPPAENNSNWGSEFVRNSSGGGSLVQYPPDGQVYMSAMGSISNLKEAASAKQAIDRLFSDYDNKPIRTSDSTVDGMLMRLSPIYAPVPTAFVGAVSSPTLCPGLLRKPAYVLRSAARIYGREAHIQVLFFEDDSGADDSFQFALNTCLQAKISDWTGYTALKDTLDPSVVPVLEGYYQESMDSFNTYSGLEVAVVGPTDQPVWRESELVVAAFATGALGGAIGYGFIRLGGGGSYGGSWQLAFGAQ